MVSDEDWEGRIPPWLSVKTYKIAAALKVRADQIGLNLGIPMRAKRNGDAMWFVITDGTQEKIKGKVIQNLSVLLCTPHCILIENNYQGEDVVFSILGDHDVYLHHLRDVGMRALTDDEVKRFLKGSL